MKIAIAGGTGQVAKEVIDALADTGRYEILVLSRSTSNEPLAMPGVTYRAVEYHDKQDLTNALRDIHTILSFIQILSDEKQVSQKNLIDAAIQAGVKRFSPSEYGSRDLEHMNWWSGKDEIRQYLAEINRTEMVLEYTLFQPGLFLEYLAFPYKTAKYLEPLQTVFDFNKCRAIVVQDHQDAILSLTSIKDLAAIIVEALAYEEQWPTTIGIQGNRLTFDAILTLGEIVRGQSFNVEYVKIEDLKVGNLKTSWKLEAKHAAVSNEEAEIMLEQVAIGILLSYVKNAWNVDDNAKKLFPSHSYIGAEEYLAAVWMDRA